MVGKTKKQNEIYGVCAVGARSTTSLPTCGARTATGSFRTTGSTIWVFVACALPITSDLWKLWALGLWVLWNLARAKRALAVENGLNCDFRMIFLTIKIEIPGK